MKHFRIYIIAAVVVLVAGVWLAAYINVNKRFPQPEEELYEKGEWVVEPQYVEADRLLDGSWVVKLENNKHQVIGNDGNIIVNEF